MNPAQLVQNRSSLLIFRDCLKLASRMVTQKEKINAVRNLVRRQFEKNKQVFDQDKIHTLKMTAVKGISNYIIHVVQMQYKLKKKQVNIMDDHQNAREDEEDLESKHFESDNQAGQSSRINEVI